MGINANEFLGGNFLKKEDLEQSKKWVIINTKKAQLDGQDKLELDLTYQNFKKAFTLNITNVQTLVDIFGNDTDNWSSKIIMLKLEDTTYKNKPTVGIRIDNDETRLVNGYEIENNDEDVVPQV